jgi:hypothetical protein
MPAYGSTPSTYGWGLIRSKSDGGLIRGNIIPDLSDEEPWRSATEQKSDRSDRNLIANMIAPFVFL